MSEVERQAEVRRPKFDGTVNLGHILTGASMLFVWGQSREV